MPVTLAASYPPPTRAAIARRPRWTLVAAAAALVLAAGCAHVPRGSLRPPPPGTAPAPATARPPLLARPRPAAGYVALRDPLPAADAMPLRERRIAIDPGHGGWFKGCIGLDGLTEAEVNLGVALELDTLLRAQGASVMLTRASDRDFLTPADSTLKSDLAERVRRANAFAPELFVSIHHNADPGGAHDVNETQTYYKLGDGGPSYDAATDVHRSLVRNVGIDMQRLSPGNFAVVRGVEAPALLTESSYLTDPDVEALLRTPQARRLEAQALDLGIVRFFARRAPVVKRFYCGLPSGLECPAQPDGVVATQSEPRFFATVGGPFDAIELRVDGRPADAVVADSLIEGHVPEPLAGGLHEATLAVRLAGEGTSVLRRVRFEVASPPERLVLDSPGQSSPRDGGLLPVRVRVLDRNGLPCANPPPCTLRVVGSPIAAPAETTLTIRDGIGWAYYRLHPRRRAREIALRAALPTEHGGHTLVVRWRERVSGPGERPLPDYRMGFARTMPAGAPLRDAQGTGGASPRLRWINRDGFARVATDPQGIARAPRLAGFRAWGPDTTWPPRYVEIAGGALAGRRVVLDPEGGGDDDAGMGASGTRAATLNLDVARALAAMLEAGGAEVRLTRDGDAAVSEVERVQLAEGFRADRYLRIGHAATTPVAGHYFASGAGRRWALGVARAFAELGLADSLRVGEVAKYALTQTSAIALYVSADRVDSAASEARLLAPGALRAEAYALFLALARDFAPEAQWPADSLDVRDGEGRPLPGAPVTLGGALVLQSGADGRVRFARTEPGPLEARIDDPRSAERVRLLDSTRGRDVREPR